MVVFGLFLFAALVVAQTDDVERKLRELEPSVDTGMWESGFAEIFTNHPELTYASIEQRLRAMGSQTYLIAVPARWRLQSPYVIRSRVPGMAERGLKYFLEIFRGDAAGAEMERTKAVAGSPEQNFEDLKITGRKDKERNFDDRIESTLLGLADEQDRYVWNLSLLATPWWEYDRAERHLRELQIPAWLIAIPQSRFPSGYEARWRNQFASHPYPYGIWLCLGDADAAASMREQMGAGTSEENMNHLAQAAPLVIMTSLLPPASDGPAKGEEVDARVLGALDGNLRRLEPFHVLEMWETGMRLLLKQNSYLNYAIIEQRLRAIGSQTYLLARPASQAPPHTYVNGGPNFLNVVIDGPAQANVKKLLFHILSDENNLSRLQHIGDLQNLF